MEETRLPFEQPVEGAPVIQCGSAYFATDFPIEFTVVSDNEAYSIYRGSKTVKLTTTADGEGDTRTNIKTVLEEIAST